MAYSLDMATTTYLPGTSVELLRRDFSPAGFAAGFPQVWVPAVVESVEPRDDRLFDVTVRLADGTYHSEIVGKRGGNKVLRHLG